MDKKVLLVDLDDTVWGLLEPWLEILNRRFGTNVHVDDCKTYSITAAFPSLTREQVYSALYDKELYEKVKVFDGASEYLNLLQEYYDIYFVSSTDPACFIYKFDLIHKFFPFIKDNHIVFTGTKQIIDGDFLVDDNLKNLEGGKYRGLLMDAPHNKIGKYPFPRFHSWKEIYDYLMNEIYGIGEFHK